MSIRQLECETCVELSDDEIEWLSSLPHPAHEVRRWNWCELEAGHTGRHASVGQDDDDGRSVTTWWVWWSDDGTHDIVTQDPCPEHLDGDSPCLLPAGHVGGHR